MKNTVTTQSQGGNPHQYELRQWLKEKKHKTSPWGDKLDRYGYSRPILPTCYNECFICGKHGICARHEVYFGVSNRTTSKATGCWLNLCPFCHQKRVHAEMEMEDGKTYDEWLKEIMEEAFIQKHSKEEFIALFGENYL